MEKIMNNKYELTPRAVYDLHKSIANHRVIMTALIDSMVLTMFADYMRTFDNPEESLVATIDSWKQILLEDKQREIANLEEDNTSITDLAIINDIINDPSFSEFAQDLDSVASDVLGVLLSQIKDKDGE